MTSEDLSDLSRLSMPARRRRRGPATFALVVTALVCLAVAVGAGLAARAAATPTPTAAQRAAAEAKAVAIRWRSLAAGRIFPATLSYTSSLLTPETAQRLAISPQITCKASIDASLTALAAKDKCRAGLRASYLDQLQGIVYTIGVLAFPTPHLAAAFSAGLPAHGSTPVLQTFALDGTASALLKPPQARQIGSARAAGPYVVLTVAGYTDGEPTGPGQQARPAIFAPAAQLAADIASVLAAPAHVDCTKPQWSC
ncbi:MAG: hypothetical protein J2P28_26955 [Actinobacteria bacterium]|nr:hypothetical protein [Actinomycetota bacterium]